MRDTASQYHNHTHRRMPREAYRKIKRAFPPPAAPTLPSTPRHLQCPQRASVGRRLKAEEGGGDSVADLVRDPHLWSRGNLVRRSDPARGEVVTQGVVPWLGRTPGRVAGCSPYPGSDNDAVLGGILGYSPQQMRCLTAPVPPDGQR
jgi:hypothetical protein